ncbi:MAG: chaperone modulator CbpM [Saprospiraceae bacterium]
MSINNIILVQHFCTHHHIEVSFIESLNEYGLITIEVIDDNKYLSIDDLKEIEKMASFYHDLGINLEGIDVISRLLRQNNILKKDLDDAHKKLALFMDDWA